MITISPPPYRKSKRIKFPPPVAPPPVALVLVEAVYTSGLSVMLTFDRAINVAAFNGFQITLRDGLQETLYQAGTASTPSANVAVLTLEQSGTYFGAETTLTATASTGIVAANDGGTWAGVTNLQLPFP